MSWKILKTHKVEVIFLEPRVIRKDEVELFENRTAVYNIEWQDQRRKMAIAINEWLVMGEGYAVETHTLEVEFQ